MLRQVMVATGSEVTASTPEKWAETFANSTVMTEGRRRHMRHSPQWALIAKHVPVGASVLEAGCGFGEWVDVMAHAGYEPAGLDYSAELVDRLRQAYPSRRWIHGDIRSMPLPDGSFDAVASWGVIEHDEAGPAAALAEFYRVVRSGGVILVSVPLDSEAQRRAASALFPERDDAVFFQYAMTMEELRDACKAAGFGIVDCGTIPGAALAMMMPRVFVWTQAGGLLRKIVARLGWTVATKFPRFHVMTYCVGRKP